METNRPDDADVEPAEGAEPEPEATLGDPPGFGEQEEAAQEEEWREDAEEGGASEL